MMVPERLFVGVPLGRGETAETEEVEVGADWADLPVRR